MYIVLILGTILALALLFVVIANRNWNPRWGDLAYVPVSGTTAKKALSILTWNIGYAGLGSEASFVADGGDYIRSLSRNEIQNASETIADKIKSSAVDVALIQENSKKSFMTRGVPVEEIIRQKLDTKLFIYWEDFKTIFVPSWLSFSHGMSIYSDHIPEWLFALKLPKTGVFYGGLLQKHYGGVVSRFPIDNSNRAWIIINVHLAGYDDDAKIRNRQCQAVIDYSIEAYKRGDFVVVGGDWNLKLSNLNLEFTEKEKSQFWLRPFPRRLLPAGWKVRTGDFAPTIRLLDQKYIEGQGFTTSVDGFLISPNVEIVRCEAQDLKFANSDHNPVLAEFIAKI